MRICSFLPAATEMLFALGLGDDVVAVSHECDFPPEALARPKLTTALVDAATMSSAEIDAAVSRALSEGRATYRVDMDVLRSAHPDLIVTQDVCVVCAVGGSEVRAAAAQLESTPRVLSLQPSRLADVCACLRSVGEEAHVSARAESVAKALEARIAAVRGRVADADRPRVLCLEWLDPAWVAGHWMPDVVDAAGGVDALGRPGEPSRRVTWEEIREARPEVAIIMPCGFGILRTLAEIDLLRTIPQLQDIPAFAADRVFVVDGSSYFSRPGPRVVDGVELLAQVLHPERFEGSLPPDLARRLPWPARAR